VLRGCRRRCAVAEEPRYRGKEGAYRQLVDMARAR
jgi:hypothetical protein